MINRIGVNNFKGIRRIGSLGLSPYQVLIGPNGSGKSTFLDVLEFVRDCLRTGPLEAVETRVPSFRDLTYNRQGRPIVVQLRLNIGDQALAYTIAINSDSQRGVYVLGETLRQLQGSIHRKLLGKTSSGKDFYRRESGKYTDSFVFGPGKLALAMTPADDDRYPIANAVKRHLTEGIRYFQLNSVAMRQPCPATRSTELDLDGTNLARVVGRLARSIKNGIGPLEKWTEHLRYAIEDIKEIGWAKRESDPSCERYCLGTRLLEFGR